MTSGLRKSNNPFLMIGSYVGLLLGLVGSYFSFAIVFGLAEEGRFTIFALGIPFVPIIVGFIFGWLIHLGIRNTK